MILTLLSRSGWCRLRHFKGGNRYHRNGYIPTRTYHEGAQSAQVQPHEPSINHVFAPTQSLVPVVMSSIVAVYGLVVSVLITGSRTSFIPRSQRSHYLHTTDSLLSFARVLTVGPDKDYPLYFGFLHLAAGLSCGLTGLSAGYAIGIVGDAVRLPSLTSHPSLTHSNLPMLTCVFLL